MSVDIRNFTRKPVPKHAYADIARAALPGWDISLVFAGEQRALKLNRMLRGKDYIPNVLSYETGKKSGEVIICLPVARQQAPEFDLSYTQFVGSLFIHGLAHLKGYRHGTTMDRFEWAYMARFIGVR